MNHGSLFSGIGGFDLAAHWAGIPTLFAVEKEPFPQQVLQKRFPKTKIYGDIFEFDGTQYRGRVDIISGGFSCQPFSLAGKRAGDKDDRHLWPQMFRVVSEIMPRWVVAENVRGITNISDGEVFEQVCIDLESIGYEIQPFIISAQSVGAPHKRERVWFVAYTDSARYEEERAKFKTEKSINNYRGISGITDSHSDEHLDRPRNILQTTGTGKGEEQRQDGQRNRGIAGTVPYEQVGDADHPLGLGRNENEFFSGEPGQEIQCSPERESFGAIRLFDEPSDTTGEGRQAARDGKRRGISELQSGLSSKCDRGQDWAENWPEAITRIYGMDDGLPGGMDRLEQRYKDRSRKDRIKACGNAIVPQIAYQIFKAITETERKNRL